MSNDILKKTIFKLIKFKKFEMTPNKKNGFKESNLDTNREPTKCRTAAHMPFSGKRIT